MMCRDCRAIADEADYEECRALAEELRANSEALSALRDEELPPLVIGIPRRGIARSARSAVAWSWIAAAAAAVLFAVTLPVLRQGAVSPQHPATWTPPVSEPLKVKILTPDPDVVIFWLIDPEERNVR
jgi:hypothetical protein